MMIDRTDEILTRIIDALTGLVVGATLTLLVMAILGVLA